MPSVAVAVGAPLTAQSVRLLSRTSGQTPLQLRVGERQSERGPGVCGGVVGVWDAHGEWGGDAGAVWRFG